MGEDGARQRGGLAAASLGFAIAAAVACWNPLAAPVGIGVGVASALLALRALIARRGSRRVAVFALALGLTAALASSVLLLVSAGMFGAELPGEPVVRPRSTAEMRQVLDEAARRSSEARRRATRELERMTGSPGRDAGSEPDGGAAGDDE